MIKIEGFEIIIIEKSIDLMVLIDHIIKKVVILV
ncbi:uncharacterized protein METZ01_LOCUS159079 [marine metagenome]|uniref:Uncharacterized protein n=1 Tax=marine metagenome TaxID=408172 RepID=A0A382AXH4_9ZZZZ